MKGKTVWFISKYLWLPLGKEAGGRSYELMREVVEQGHRCVMFVSDSSHLFEAPAFTGSHLVEDCDGVTVCWIRTMKFGRAQSIRRVLSWISFEWKLLWLSKSAFPRPDVVVASSLSLLSVFSGLAFKFRYRARFVFEIRDIWPLTLLSTGSWSRRNPLIIALGWVERLGYARADAIVGTMPNLGEHVAAVLGHRTDVTCIPQGVAERTLTESATLPAGYLDDYLPCGHFIVGYAGTFGISNILGPVYEAVGLLQNDPRIHFVMVGSGGLLDDHKRRYAHLRNLTFAPWIPKGSVPTFLSNCDLLILSTDLAPYWRFGQSLNKLVDYMLAGKPIVAAYTGYESMLNEARSGSFVPADDPGALAKEIVRFADMEPEDREAMGGRGRAWLLENRLYSRLASEYAAVLFPDYPDREPEPDP